MSDNLLLIPFGNETLALTPEQYQEARERGRALMPATATASPGADDRILDAEGAAQLTGVPASWFEQQMREGRIPHLQFGKYRRLRVADLLVACETRGRPGDKSSPPTKLRLAGKGKT